MPTRTWHAQTPGNKEYSRRVPATHEKADYRKTASFARTCLDLEARPAKLRAINTVACGTRAHALVSHSPVRRIHQAKSPGVKHGLLAPTAASCRFCLSIRIFPACAGPNHHQRMVECKGAAGTGTQARHGRSQDHSPVNARFCQADL